MPRRDPTEETAMTPTHWSRRDLLKTVSAAAAGLKCTRFGGSMGAPKRDEVEAFLAKQG